jgi:RNA polymerase primary sigma factor
MAFRVMFDGRMITCDTVDDVVALNFHIQGEKRAPSERPLVAIAAGASVYVPMGIALKSVPRRTETFFLQNPGLDFNPTEVVDALDIGGGMMGAPVAVSTVRGAICALVNASVLERTSALPARFKLAEIAGKEQSLLGPVSTTSIDRSKLAEAARLSMPRNRFVARAVDRSSLFGRDQSVKYESWGFICHEVYSGKRCASHRDRRCSGVHLCTVHADRRMRRFLAKVPGALGVFAQILATEPAPHDRDALESARLMIEDVKADRRPNNSSLPARVLYLLWYHVTMIQNAIASGTVIPADEDEVAEKKGKGEERDPDPDPDNTEGRGGGGGEHGGALPVDDVLPLRARQVLGRRGRNETLAAIGSDLGITGSRVQQIESWAHRALRDAAKYAAKLNAEPHVEGARQAPEPPPEVPRVVPVPRVPVPVLKPMLKPEKPTARPRDTSSPCSPPPPPLPSVVSGSGSGSGSPAPSPAPIPVPVRPKRAPKERAPKERASKSKERVFAKDTRGRPVAELTVKSRSWRDIGPEEEARLVAAFQAGDRAAGQTLLLAHEPLLFKLTVQQRKIAARGQGLDADDILQAARLGFMRGLETYDPARGFRISTYVGWWIRHHASRELTSMNGDVSLPINIKETIQRARALNIDTVDGLVEAGLLQQGKTMVRGAKAFEDGRYLATRLLSLDAPLRTHGEGGRHDVAYSEIVSSEAPDAYDLLLRADEEEEARDDVESYLAVLSPRERKILLARFLEDEEGDTQTLKKIGDEFNLSRERIRQIQAAAIAKVKSVALGEPMPTPRRSRAKEQPPTSAASASPNGRHATLSLPLPAARKPKTCGACGEPGHNVQTCLLRLRASP